jgi:hypothetical protein
MEQEFAMRREVLEEHPAGRVVMVDTIAHIEPSDAAQVVVCGSHGGISSAEYAARVPLAAVFLNDAGGGKDDAGRACLGFLDLRGMAAATVSHESAVIGDALDTWESGVISGVNEHARLAGYVVGAPVKDSVRAALTGRGHAE